MHYNHCLKIAIIIIGEDVSKQLHSDYQMGSYSQEE